VRPTAGGYLATDGPKKNDEANRDRRSCRRLERKVLGPAGNTGGMALTSQLLHADAEVMRRAVALLEAHGLGQAGGARGRAAAETLAGIAPDPEALATALLLPALEDGCLDLGTIEKRAGTETARLVASAARIAVLKAIGRSAMSTARRAGYATCCWPSSKTRAAC
jgi:hypothetical protein